MQKYIRYVFRNIEPVRIADDSTSQSGQTNSLRYISGTAVRGVVVNALAGTDGFEEIKKQLFSNEVRYLNAYIMAGENELMPSPKGFYEDKSIVDGKKAIQNLVAKGEFTEGNKRASLGRYCYIDGDCIRFFSVDTGSDMKIKINVAENEKQNVFRNEYIAAGHVFCGYIAVDDEEIGKRIREVLKGTIIIGNGRSAGLGKCMIDECEFTEELPYARYVPQESQTQFCYMMLLSNTAMRNKEGELCGFDLPALQKKFGVEELEIDRCSTSTVEVKGYNRTWGGKIPSAVMYEQGSVFRFKFTGTLEKDKLLQICHEGIGIRKNEGFGRVLFLDNYKGIQYKLAGKLENGRQHVPAAEKEDEKVLTIAAKSYYRNQIRSAMNRYVVKNPIPRSRISNSQLGIIESFSTAFRYEPEEAIRSLKEYFTHAGEKEDRQNVQKQRTDTKEVKRFVEHILKTSLEELLGMDTEKKSVMGIARDKLVSPEEEQMLKLELLTAMIRFENKKEGK